MPDEGKKHWLREHGIELVGVAAGVVLLLWVWMQGKGSPAVARPSPVTSGAGGGTSGGTAAGGVSQSDLANLQKQITGTIGELAKALQQAEAQDVATLTASLQVSQGQLSTLQQASTAAGQKNDALAQLVADLKTQIAGLQAGRTTPAAVPGNLSGSIGGAVAGLPTGGATAPAAPSPALSGGWTWNDSCQCWIGWGSPSARGPQP